jgi:RHH-type transcriptional regulator, proline utilization regulon repressor / proline dehydrogenase / delta 1-pyrroline-5-carboxylate dehydrogenase
MVEEMRKAGIQKIPARGRIILPKSQSSENANGSVSAPSQERPRGRSRGPIRGRPRTNSNAQGGKSQFRLTQVTHEVAGQRWSFCFDSLYEEVFADGEFFQSLKDEMSFKLAGPYRFSHSWRAIPLLVQVEASQSRVRIFSWRGQTESFLLENGLLRDSAYRQHAESLLHSEPKEAPVDIDFLTRKYQLQDFDLPKFKKVHEKSRENQEKIGHLLKSYRPQLSERVSDFSLTLTSRYVLIRVHLLKFLAILPSLDHDEEGHVVRRILLESIRRLHQDQKKLQKKSLPKHLQGKTLPFWILWPILSLKPVLSLLPTRVLAQLIRNSVRFIAKRFIAGEDIERATESLVNLRKTGREATLDQLGEWVVSEKEADDYHDRVLELIRGFSSYVPKGERNKAGILSAHVSIKVSALASRFIPEAFEATYALVAPRLKSILLEAKKEQVFINVDAEHYSFRDLVFRIYKRVLLETPELKDFDDTGIVVQAYLRDAYTHLEDIISLAKKRRLKMPVRLVKGAYWDAETIEARAHSFKAPEFINKEETDIHFRQLVYRIFEASPHVSLSLASHNLYDHAFAEALKEEMFPHLPAFEHQCLHMTYEGLSTALEKWGVPTRNYVPVGSLLVGMAYLVRRIMENSSQVGFLSKMRKSEFEGTETPSQIFKRKKAQGLIDHDFTREVSGEFENVSPFRLYLAKHQREFFSAINKMKELHLGQGALNPFFIRLGTVKEVSEWTSIFSPSDSKLLVGKIQFAHKEDVPKAVDWLSKPDHHVLWRRIGTQRRVEILLKAAGLMTIRRAGLASLVLFEAGKSLKEALGDVDEAIDFLNFYAREELRLSQNLGRSRARGLVTVITPWNFPLAIPCGMVSAALVAGNSVILKSAEQTPLIAQVMVNLFYEAGVPQEALLHLPGLGEEVGAALVEEKRVDAFVFTGSKEVGTAIAKAVGRRVRRGRPVKVVTEMGGKNAILVTSSAELDETVEGALYSVYAHAGQKCSALSRILVDASVKDRFLERFSEASLDLKVGAAWDPATYANPVIGQRDRDRLREVARLSVKEAASVGGKTWVDRSQEVLAGYGVGPVVIELPASSAAQPESMCAREHFGPVVHVLPYESLQEAVELFNSTEYALTGGIYSQSQDDIDFITEGAEAGNLYVNRPCTGARVAVEPFGGFKLSGTGPKAGGKAYLEAFHQLDRRERVKEIVIPEDLDVKSDVEHFSEEPLEALDRPVLIQEVLSWIKKDSTFSGEEQKQAFVDFLNWSKKYLHSWIENGEMNRRTPGQLNLNDHRLFKERGLLVCDMDQIDFSLWMSALSALLLGAELSIWVEEKSYASVWESRVESLARLGLSVSMLKKKSREDFICDAEFFILGVPDQDKERWLAEIYDHPKFGTAASPRIPLVLTSEEGPSVWAPSELYRSFIQTRSMAVNTMRHGAPLDVND